MRQRLNKLIQGQEQNNQCMDVMTEKDIRIVDSLFNPSERPQQPVTYYRGEDNKIRYKVWIQLEGRDVYYVDYVHYRLHGTFPDPLRKVKRTITNTNCSLAIWTWGIFELGVEIFLKTGERIVTSHHMTYGYQLTQGGLKFNELKENNPYIFE